MVVVVVPGGPLTSEGRAKVQDCWKGQEPELNTWMLKSTETQQQQHVLINHRSREWLGGALGVQMEVMVLKSVSTVRNVVIVE